MKLSPLQDRELIAAACTQFQSWWDGQWRNHREKQPCPCDGSVADLDALSYCAYELGFPDRETFGLTSVVWGQIIEKHANLRWGTESGELVLVSIDYPRYIMYPRIRVMEMMNRSMTQFDQFSLLTESVLYEMLASDFSADDLPLLIQLAAKAREHADSNFGDRMNRVQKQLGNFPNRL